MNIFDYFSLPPKVNRAPQIERVQLGQVYLPLRMESRHISLSGTTGAGKTVALRSLLPTIRRRGDTAIVVDAGGELLDEFGREGDALFSPLDARSRRWDPIEEIETVADVPRLAMSFIPPAGEAEADEWAGYARTLVGGVAGKVQSIGELEQALFHFPSYPLDQESPTGDSLAELLAGEPAAQLFEPGASRMLASIRGIVGSKLSWLPYSAAITNEKWSVKKWAAAIDGQGKKSEWIWLPVRADHAHMLAPFVVALVEQIVLRLLSLPPSNQRRVWLIVDELGAYPQIPSLVNALTQGRKFGVRVVIGIQSVAQLISMYGQQGAQTLLSCFGTHLILRAGDPDTADWGSRLLGHREVIHRSRTIGDHGDSKSEQLREEAAVLASELMRLPDLMGWLKVPGDYPIGKINLLIPVRGDGRIEPFIPAPWIKKIKQSSTINQSKTNQTAPSSLSQNF